VTAVPNELLNKPVLPYATFTPPAAFHDFLPVGSVRRRIQSRIALIPATRPIIGFIPIRARSSRPLRWLGKSADPDCRILRKGILSSNRENLFKAGNGMVSCRSKTVRGFTS